MTLLELIENYGPAVFADSEMGIVIQRNGSYLNLAREVRAGVWEHVDCRSVEADAYNVSLWAAREEAEAWYEELTKAEDDYFEKEEVTDGLGG